LSDAHWVLTQGFAIPAWRHGAAHLTISRHMPAPNPHELIPLELAVRSIREQAYPERSLGAFLDEQLNGIAYVVAALVPLYEVNDAGKVRAITPDELQHGYFRRSAKELHFLDNRPSLRALAITTSAVETVVRSILTAKAS
jgi:hypothetical protein